MTYGRIALLAQLVEDGLVFTQVVDTPMGHRHHNTKVQDGAEHQHERDGQGEDQEREHYNLGYGHAAPAILLTKNIPSFYHPIRW